MTRTHAVNSTDSSARFLSILTRTLMSNSGQLQLNIRTPPYNGNIALSHKEIKAKSASTIYTNIHTLRLSRGESVASQNSTVADEVKRYSVCVNPRSRMYITKIQLLIRRKNVNFMHLKCIYLCKSAAIQIAAMFSHIMDYLYLTSKQCHAKIMRALEFLVLNTTPPFRFR